MEAQIAGDFSTSGTFTACNPRGEVGDALEAKMIDSFTFLGESLPDNLPREPRPELTPARQAQLLNLKVGIRATRRIAFLIFLFPLIPLLFIQILTVRSFRSFLGWYGWGLLGGGLLSLLILIDLIPLGLTNVIFGGNALDPANVQFIVVLLAVVHKITQPILMMGGIIAGVGLIFVIFAFILPHPPEEIVEETTEYFGQPEGQAGG
jgi:hypothetical protein